MMTMPRFAPRFCQALLLAATLAVAAPALAQARPDTDFCLKMRARDPGGICTAKGEYVTPETVYLPDGRIVDRSTGR